MGEPTKRALVTGITGQDGAYLAQLLLDKGYQVHGIKRRSSSFNTGRIEDIYQDPHEPDPRLILHYGDMTDATNLIRIVKETQPDEIYNLGAQIGDRPARSLRLNHSARGLASGPISPVLLSIGFWFGVSRNLSNSKPSSRIENMIV